MNLFDAAWRFFLAGGPVMPPLLLVSLWLWTAIFLKLRWLLGVRKERLDRETAARWLAGASPPGEGSQGLQGRALAWFIGARTGNPQTDLRLWRAGVARQGSQTGRHLALIAVLAAVAPLLGLLGTVNGMINTFEAIQRFGTGNAQALAAGISEALITTQAGLVVAIPGLLVGYYLKRQVKKVQQGLLAFQQMVEKSLLSREAA